MVGGGWFAAEAQQEGGWVCKQGNRQEMAKPGDQTPSTRSYKETRERRREIEDGIKMVWRGRREKVQEQAMATPESERLDGKRVPVQLTIGNRVGVSRMHKAHSDGTGFNLLWWPQRGPDVQTSRCQWEGGL